MTTYFRLGSPHGNLSEYITEVLPPAPPNLFVDSLKPFSTQPTLTTSWNLILTKTKSNEYSLNEIKLQIVNKLSDLEQIEKIYFDKNENVIIIYIIVNENNRDRLYEIFDKEYEIIENTPNYLLEFKVIIRNNRPLETIISFKQDPIFEK